MGLKGKIIGATISTVCMLAGAGVTYYKKRKARRAEKNKLKETKKAEKEENKLIKLQGKTEECVSLIAKDKENLDILKKLSEEIEKMDEKELEDIETTFSKIIVNAETGETALEWFDRVFPNDEALKRELTI